ncbi:MAG TPA: formyl transferase, partial [Alcanivorax sp.]|nr:formyl transferase [Alcanivorax sp.]
DVERKIRAFWFPPYDGAYKVINGVKCTLVSRTILESLADPSTSSLFTQPSD